MNEKKRNKRNSRKRIQIPTFRKIQIPSDLKDENFWKRVTLFQLIYSLTGIIVGLLCIIGGMVLFIHGVIGETSWTAKFLGAESNISDAAPGSVLFIVGLFIVWITKFDIEVKK